MRSEKNTFNDWGGVRVFKCDNYKSLKLWYNSEEADAKFNTSTRGDALTLATKNILRDALNLWFKWMGCLWEASENSSFRSSLKKESNRVPLIWDREQPQQNLHNIIFLCWVIELMHAKLDATWTTASESGMFLGDSKINYKPGNVLQNGMGWLERTGKEMVSVETCGHLLSQERTVRSLKWRTSHDVWIPDLMDLSMS